MNIIDGTIVRYKMLRCKYFLYFRKFGTFKFENDGKLFGILWKRRTN